MAAFLSRSAIARFLMFSAAAWARDVEILIARSVVF